MFRYMYILYPNHGCFFTFFCEIYEYLKHLIKITLHLSYIYNRYLDFSQSLHCNMKTFSYNIILDSF